MAIDALPARHEAGERAGLDRLDLLAQRRERGAAQPAQHLAVTPLAAAATGPELTLNQVALALEPATARRRSRRRSARAARLTTNGPWVIAYRATTRVSASGTSARNASGRPPGGTAPSASRYSPASPASIQRSSPPSLTFTARRSPQQRLQHRLERDSRHHARGELRLTQVAERAQHVVKLITGRDAAIL